MKTALTSMQWMLYILMGSIAIPVAIAGAYGLEGASLTGFVSSVLFVLSIAGILQVLFGHGLPIIEGPAGVWWGVFILYSALGVELYGSANDTLRILGFCFIASGIVFVVLSLIGLVDKIAKLFTPTVIGAYLVLLVVQLSGTFLKAMAGVSGTSSINLLMFGLSMLTVALAFVYGRIKALGSYATLFSILTGWILFAVFGLAPSVHRASEIIKIPSLFPFGMPTLDLSMGVNALLLTFLLISNLLASISAMRIVFKNLEQPLPKDTMKRVGIVSGIIHMLAGAFGAIGSVPISGSAAFVAQTKNTAKKPFIIGNVLIGLISLSPVVTSFFSALPVAVGYAALVPTFGFGTIGIALNQLDRAENKPVRNIATGIGWFIGIAIMFFPATAFSALNPLIRTISSNGLIIGTVAVVIVEQTMMRKAAVAQKI